MGNYDIDVDRGWLGGHWHKSEPWSFRNININRIILNWQRTIDFRNNLFGSNSPGLLYKFRILHVHHCPTSHRVTYQTSWPLEYEQILVSNGAYNREWHKPIDKVFATSHIAGVFGKEEQCLTRHLMWLSQIWWCSATELCNRMVHQPRRNGPKANWELGGHEYF